MNPILGTAMWGWTIPESECFHLLDLFYETGYRDIDGATNYPINKNSDDFRLAESILDEWIKANGIDDLKIMMKFGSINNMMTPENNLTKAFILMVLDEYKYKFGSNLDSLFIHWDNRKDEKAIRKTFEALALIEKEKFHVGLSGIKYPEIYAKLNKEFGFDFKIQIKHNIFESAYNHYKSFHGKERFIAYGINSGGLKLNKDDYNEDSSIIKRGKNTGLLDENVSEIDKVIREANENSQRTKIQNFSHLALVNAFYGEEIESVILGTSNTSQLKDSLTFLNNLKEYDYSDVFNNIRFQK